jgi:acyl-CoA synthetase (AMP-forming)/AMP-acid ligase II
MMRDIDSIDDVRLVSEIVPTWAKLAPGRVALVEGTRQWTYRELARDIEVTADWLRAKGIRRGDRAMLVCENCAISVAIVLAIISLGAWPVIVNARLSDREVDEIIEHSGARRVFLTPSVSLKARAHGERLGAATEELADLGPIAVTPLNDKALIETPDNDETACVAALFYTSGTTGKPKGVMLTHRNLVFVARASGYARELTADDRVYAVLPISHILGFTGVLLGTLMHGARVHLVSRFDPALALSALERDGISVMIGTPSMYAMTVEYAARKARLPLRAPALRLISSAGAPLDAATKAAAEQAFGRVLHNGYGITECSPTITLTSLNAPRNDCSIGRLLPCIEARLAGGADVGELQIRGPGVMKGYYRALEATKDAIDEEGWFRTGDLARVDDGNYFIVGRAKEMIIRFGFNVYPAEVEGVLNGYEGVARSAVIGQKGEGGEEVVAYVQPSEDARLTEAGLAAYAAERLAPYKHPSRIVILKEMPMTPAGKILKSALV